MVRVAELLADLTLLKTIDSSQALSIISPDTWQSSLQSPGKVDHDLARVEEFLDLRSEQIEHEELDVKRRQVAEALAGGSKREETPDSIEEGRRMAGAWGRGR